MSLKVPGRCDIVTTSFAEFVELFKVADFKGFKGVQSFDEPQSSFRTLRDPAFPFTADASFEGT